MPDDFRTLLQPGGLAGLASGFDDADGSSTVDLGDESPLENGNLVGGAAHTELDDGNVAIDLDPQPKVKPNQAQQGFDANLALQLTEGEMALICSRLLQAIEMDDQSRQDWIDDRAAGISLLGLKIESPKSDTGSAAPLEGMSSVRHPLLLEAVTRFQSNASAELLPASGPVKVRNDGTPRPPDLSVPPQPGQSPLDMAGLGHNGGPPIDDGQDSDELAEALEKDMNYYLTAVDRGYRADFDRMLFQVGFGGCGFRKVYNDPIRRMPLSRSVDAKDLIVNNAEADFDDCRRITHRIKMRTSQVIRMQLAGVYRKVALQQPTMNVDAVEEKIAETSGINPNGNQPEDLEHTIYECYCELDLPGFEHTDEDENQTGLELPYRVTMDKDTRIILAIHRNWSEDDETCLPKKVFVKYPFVPYAGFYEIGLLQILGNATRALTAAWREGLDSGMFANFPGFLYADVGGRQVTNEFRVAPGAGQRIQTGGKPINQIVMNLPYKELGPGFMSLMQQIESTAQRVGGTAEQQVAEGKQDAPVGTTLAMLEQAKVMLVAVHVRMHAAQSEEFQLLKDRFREDPSALWRKNKRPAHPWSVEQFLEALDTYDLVPAADPNIASHMQRIMKAMAIKQLQQMSPELYIPAAVDRHVMTMMGINDISHLFNPNPPPPPDPNAGADPAKMAEVQVKQQALQQKEQQDQATTQAKLAGQEQQHQARMQELAVESADRQADRESRERVALTRVEQERIKVEGEAAQHQTPSGDTLAANHADLMQHFHPSGDATIGAHADMAQHLNPSGDATLGAHADMLQHQTPSAEHVTPSADGLASAHAALTQHQQPSGDSILSAATAPPPGAPGEPAP